MIFPLMTHMRKNIASCWFLASEATGDFMGIRYGRVPHGSDTVEWHFVSHCDCDGIGGFARLLRERGAVLDDLPRTKTPCRGTIGPLWRLWRGSREVVERANRRDWGQMGSKGVKRSDDSETLAWSLFTEEQTQNIRERCRRDQVTVNSILLKHLDQAVRPDIGRPRLKIPWMIPVNLRGDIHYDDDTENHVSCVEVQIDAEDAAESVHKQILHRLKRGEHRANYLILKLGRLLTHKAKIKYLNKDRSKEVNGNIGAFSNLGVWDPEKKIQTDDSWLFCPPVVSGQLLGAGCVTFQNRLGLVIQGNPRLRFPPDIASDWMTRWVTSIGRD